MPTKFWKYFETLNEYVYATDIDTYELIYANKKLRESVGFKALDELIGKKCYEVLQGNARPCKICNSKKLKEGCFKEWDYYNPKFNKHTIMKDMLIEDEGKRIRVSIAIDTDTSSWQSFSTRKKLEAQANEALRAAMESPHPNESFAIILEYLGNALDAERTYIFEKRENGNDDNTYEWTARGIQPQKQNLQNVPSEICATWYQAFGDNKEIIISNLEEVKDTALYEILKGQNINSLVVVPLYDNGKTVGFYGVDNPPKDKLKYASEMLHILGHFIVSALKRRNLMIELHTMGYRDWLTKIGNRRAMNEFISLLSKGESIGVVYCDLTGLKETNDTKSHKAGDDLIVRAVECLKKNFDGQGIFRIGGDELLVLCRKLSENDLNERIYDLMNSLYENSVVLAIGTAYEKELVSTVDSLVMKAEKTMYENKSNYYRRTGIERRKR